MEHELEATEYERPDGTGKTITYEGGMDRDTLAHVDYYADGVEVTVFKPYLGSMRTYAKRPEAKALGIVARHLASEGYDMATAAIRKIDPAAEIHLSIYKPKN